MHMSSRLMSFDVAIAVTILSYDQITDMCVCVFVQNAQNLLSVSISKPFLYVTLPPYPLWLPFVQSSSSNYVCKENLDFCHKS